MFIERLNKNDIENYLEYISKLGNYTILQKNLQKVYDEQNQLESINFNICLEDEEGFFDYQQYVLKDFENAFFNKWFFAKKFGMEYINSYNQYLKETDEENRKQTISNLTKYYYKHLFDNTDNLKQATLLDYQDDLQMNL